MKYSILRLNMTDALAESYKCISELVLNVVEFLIEPLQSKFNPFNTHFRLQVVGHTFNPSTLEAEASRTLFEFEVSMAYRVSSSTVKATERTKTKKKLPPTKKKNSKLKKKQKQTKHFSELLLQFQTRQEVLPPLEKDF